MFDIIGSKIKINVDDLAIPPFKDYYNNAKNKSQALKEIEYVVWLYKWNTPYEAYPENERASKVAKDVLNVDSYEPNDDLKQLIVRFKELQETTGTRLLKASQRAAEGIIDTLNAYGSTEMDIDTAINKKSGLLGISGISSDSRDIEINAENGNKRCILAQEMFSRRVVEYIAKYYLKLGKVDAIIFTAGGGDLRAQEDILYEKESFDIDYSTLLAVLRKRYSEYSFCCRSGRDF